MSRRVLMAGVSLSALAATPGFAATAPNGLSPAWFAARVDASTAAAATAGSAVSTLNQMTTATQNLTNLASRLQAMEAAQTAAASAAAAAASIVPNGLVTGGLNVAPGAASGSALWMGADLPTQAVTAAGRTEVTVTQTAAQASLTWQTFNVGAKTDLAFDQSAGGANASSWVVLNRVEDPAALPSQILGSIKAPGKVYLINADGILFGAGSQVNIGGLVASTGTISDAQFANGLYGASDGASSFLPSFTGAAADSAIIVQQGAEITTAAPSSVTAGGGAVLLLGGTVENDGVIETPDGQALLAGGQDFILRAGYSTSGNATATVIGSQVEATGTLGSATNNGLIIATTGDITLAAHDVTQGGIAISTTSVATRGTVHLLNADDDATGSVTLGPGSVTVVNPDNSATTALDSQRESLIVQSAANNALRAESVGATNPQLDDVSTLADRLDLSRIEIVTGGTAAFDGSSLTMAQGGQIAVQAAGRAFVGDGAELDVSGSTGAVLPMSSNALVVNIQGNELRDAPVNRDTGLISSNNVTLDIQDLLQVAASSADANVRDYTRGGLLEVSGYLGTIGHTIDEWDAVGGTITLASALAVTAPGAELNVSGGAVTVQGGYIPQSYLIGADGNLYNVNTAPANIQYVGVYGGLTVDYQRFGGSSTWNSVLATGARLYESGYVYGRDAGSVVVNAQTAVLEGGVDAGVVEGFRQDQARAAGVTDPYAYSQDTIALPGSLAVGGFDPFGNLATPDVTLTDDYTPVAESIGLDGDVPADILNTITLSASQLGNEGLGGLSVITGGSILVDGGVTLAPGGTLTLQGSAVAVGANLVARGGAITIGDEITNPVTGTTTAQATPAGTTYGAGVAIGNGATLDLRGEYTNAVTGPAAIAAEALANGGNLVVRSASFLSVGGGTVIDASSGGALLANGKTLSGKGGDVTLAGDDPFYTTVPGDVSIDAVLRDAGLAGGGTLSITAPGVVIGDPGTLNTTGMVLLPAATFLSGFSDYVIDGANGLTVTPGTVLTVAEPVYTFYDANSTLPTAPTGTDPSAVFQLILPPSFQTDRANGRLTQRQGAGIELIANDEPGTADIGGGTITLGAGSEIAVDPGQSVRIEAYGQITDDATITAHGGSVAIVNEQREVLAKAETAAEVEGLSVWIGGDASIDVSGIAEIADDVFGRPYGIVTAGGSIELGSDAGTQLDGNQIATKAEVLVRPGAVLDAAGAAGTIDLLAGTVPQLGLDDMGMPVPGGSVPTDPVAVATDGGSIAARSYGGISLEGSLLAQAGGLGALGGTLSLVLENPAYATAGVQPPNALRVPRVISISEQTAAPLQGDADLAPGDPVPAGAYGTAAVSQQMLDAGGFDSVSLYARDAFVFQGDVALQAKAAISLQQGIIADSTTDGSVLVAAPYVQLTGETNLGADVVSYGINGQGWKPYDPYLTGNATPDGSFTVQADLVDVSNAVRFGVTDTLALEAPLKGTPTSYAGFADVALASSGDIRFATGSITTPGNVELAAQRIYPVTGAVANVFAGFDAYTTVKNSNYYITDGVIAIRGVAGADAAAVPYSVGGSLGLYAGVIDQGGVVRAPEGSLTLGSVTVVPAGLQGTQSFTYSVDLQPGSVTSVSLDGLAVPYGGTVDGVTYSYDGTAVTTGFDPVLTLAGQVQTVEQGATLDLSGGGTLAGAGFISGRGGSTNVLTTPLLAFDAATGAVSAATLGSEPVYAIVPGYGAGYAPISPVEASGSGGSVPLLGSQITIAGVPGVAGGTYTLLPSYYALLPGAARVQIDSGAYDRLPGVTALGAGSYELNATTGVANIGAQDDLPVQVVVTTAAGVAADSQFDTETYSQFVLAQAAQYGAPRGTLPEDGKTLSLLYPATAAAVTALTYAGAASFAAATGGYAGQATIGGAPVSDLLLEITPDGATPTPGFVSVQASALDALAAPRLVVGGSLVQDPLESNQLDFHGTADELVVRDGAVLQAAEVFLTADAVSGDPDGGAITVEDGATVSTLGQGAPPFDSSAGYYYNADGYTVVALSNGRLQFTPSISKEVAFGAISIADGASLLSGGTLNFVTDQSLSLGVNATYGARYLSVDVDTIDVVSDQALADAAAGSLVLPSGLVLTEDVLSRLLTGNAATGAPGLLSLTLTAAASINFAGSVTLDTTGGDAGAGLQSLVLNTPAIYGYGAAGDVARIATGTLYWNGIESTSNIGASTVKSSALPGAIAANAAGVGLGTLEVDAQTIVLGYGPDTAADDQTTLDRLIEGFASVDLNASSSFSGNNKGSLSVYQTPGAVFGAAGTGGDLTITTPLMTGAAGSVDSITAGGALVLQAAGAASTATGGALGAEIDLSAASISDNTAVQLASGRLVLTAAGGDVALGGGARIDLSGEAVPMLDQTEFTGGGSLVVTATGDVTQAAGGTIDVSSPGAKAGSVQVTAATGAVGLDGAIVGGAVAGQQSGSFELQAGTLADFDALNAMLDTGLVFGARDFEIGSGDLLVDKTVTAQAVSIAVDGGSLTVSGTIDASGAAAGSIALSAGNGLTVADGALLDAHGTVLQADSTGAAIESENRAIVGLTASGGTLTLGNATIDVAAPDGLVLGQVNLTAPRTVAADGTEGGDIAVAAAGPVAIVGAATVALYGSRTYVATDANGTIEQTADPANPAAITLDQLNADNIRFLALAGANAGLTARTAGLSAYGAVYHLRPADVIESSAGSGGDLTVVGDLDLSTLRYGAAAAGGGAGEVGMLSLRAARNLVVNGSISDGFATPEDAAMHTADDNGWVLYASEPLGQAVTLPVDAPAIQLTTGTSFSTANPVALNFNINVASGTLGANQLYPTAVTTSKAYAIPAGGLVATAAITGPDGTVIAAAGTVLAAGTAIPVGSVFAAGTVVPFSVAVAAGQLWPAGALLSDFTGTSVALSLAKGQSLTIGGGATIPAGSKLVFVGGAKSVAVRATGNGVQGLIYAAAPLLAAGTQSWSINLVAGANLAGSNVLGVQPAASLTGAAANGLDPAGSLVLDDVHYTLAKSSAPSASFSVVRTGTGTLNLVAGGNLDEQSLFGIYTAGTDTSLGATADAAYQAGRATIKGGTVLGSAYAAYDAVVASETQYYPDHGGNVLVSAQGDVVGDTVGYSAFAQLPGSDAVGDWLWRQGGSGLDQATSWWINFGSYVLPLDADGNVVSNLPVLTGFTGIGALGGGNVTVVAGHDAGEVTDLALTGEPISQGLVIAVGGTGRVVGDTVDTTGGGLLTLDVGGSLNPAAQRTSSDGAGGTLTDLRGNIDVSAGQVGRIDLVYNQPNATDPRPDDPFTTQYATSANGLIVVPGDGAVEIDALRDLVLQGAGDPGRESEQALTAVDPSLLPATGTGYAGNTGFSLWTDATAISLVSDGGNLTPLVLGTAAGGGQVVNDPATDDRYVYPGTLAATAASGSFYYGQQGISNQIDIAYSLELAPTPAGELSLLAEGSIYGHGYAIDMSGADDAAGDLPTPLAPSYTDNSGSPFAVGVVSDFLNDLANVPSPDALFGFEADTPTTDLHAGDTDPNRVYAVAGDLVDTQFGEVLLYKQQDNISPGIWYLAAKPTWIMAGRDIVSSGKRPGIYPVGYGASAFATYPNLAASVAQDALTSGNLLLNNGPDDVSVFSAGRDILSSYVYVAGPGQLQVSAGRNITDTGDQGLDFGVLKSVGPVVGSSAADRSGGASISVLTGDTGLNDTAFAALYFDAANQADLGLPLTDPANGGKVQQTYQVQLLSWLQSHYGYTGTTADALAYFQALPAPARDVFVRQVFYTELTASGRQESDSASLFYKSYARGRAAIATLFPTTTADGSAISYSGDLTMDSGTLAVEQEPGGAPVVFDAGISTLFGGNIQILSPGGQQVFGVTGGPVPGASSGVITYGSGDIDIYALGDVLLGQSRIFTTFGGNILIWSAAGDINAGRGSKTTTVDQPPLISYDPYGSVTLAPTAPTAGAGIATLSPIPGTTPGDVDLVAPLGTIDAGEAGIRVSGNLNIAALSVLNAANVQVQGKTTGNTASVATNTAAATAAASAAGSQVNAAANAGGQRQQQVTEVPSVITVEIIGDNDDEKRAKRRRPAA